MEKGGLFLKDSKAASLILYGISPLAKLQLTQMLSALYDQAYRQGLVAMPHMHSPMIIKTISTGLSIISRYRSMTCRLHAKYSILQRID
jgi:hypothetical protein